MVGGLRVRDGSRSLGFQEEVFFARILVQGFRVLDVRVG